MHIVEFIYSKAENKGFFLVGLSPDRRSDYFFTKDAGEDILLDLIDGGFFNREQIQDAMDAMMKSPLPDGKPKRLVYIPLQVITREQIDQAMADPDPDAVTELFFPGFRNRRKPK